MASRSAPRGAPPRKMVTYAKASRDQKGAKTAPATSDANRSSSMYDFPDSDGSTSSPPRLAAPSTTGKASKPRSRDNQAALKNTTLAPSPIKRTSTDNGRKRKLSSNSDGDVSRKQAQTSKLPSAPSASRPKQDRPTVSPGRKAPMARPATVTAARNKPPAPAVPPKSPIVRNAPKPKPKSPPMTPRDDSASSTPRPRKLRLIDRLSAQRAESSGSDSDAASESDGDLDAMESGASQRDASASQTPSQTPTSKRVAFLDDEMWTRPIHSQAAMSASKKIRHTYSQMRSMRDDVQPEGDVFGMSGDLDNDPLLSSPTSKPSPAMFASQGDEFDMDDDDDDDDEDPKMAIKSVHELRRAGANNRFSDEMEDLLSRIGTPSQPTSSLRRNALLELAQKLQRKEFASQFRDHLARDSIAERIGDEEDVISGFAMAASLVMFLSSNNAPNLLRRLVEEKVSGLLGRLLRIPEDIDSIAMQRKANLSKIGRGTVGGIKSHLRKLSIWHGYEAKEVSPRTVALQLQYILQRNLEVRYRSGMVKDLDGVFTSIAEDQAQNAPPDDAITGLVILIMESDLGTDMTTLGTDQLRSRASSAAVFLQNALASWPESCGEVQSAALKLAIDTTNTEIGAGAFGDGPLLAVIARSIHLGLSKAQEAVESRALDASMYDGLLLIMGIMINVLEHFPLARSSLDRVSTEQLAGLFSKGRESVGDADSEEKSKVSVAVGYLAVILGYLCLEGQNRAVVADRTQGAGIVIVIDAIREFINLYRSVDAKVHELEGLVQNLRRYSR